MISSAEAAFFLGSYPETKIDDDRDGIPCGQQWFGG
jgi:hypothetical protein